MSNNIEIIMDIETLEIFEVISSDDNSKDDLASSEEVVEKQVLTSKSYHFYRFCATLVISGSYL